MGFNQLLSELFNLFDDYNKKNPLPFLVAYVEGLDDIADEPKDNYMWKELTDNSINILTFMDYVEDNKKSIIIGKLYSGLKKIGDGGQKELELLKRFEKEESINNSEILEMQKIRNLDLYLYLDVFSTILDLRKDIDNNIKHFFTEFGIIDITLSDFITIEEDIIKNSYNPFMIWSYMLKNGKISLNGLHKLIYTKISKSEEYCRKKAKLIEEEKHGLGIYLLEVLENRFYLFQDTVELDYVKNFA